LSTLGAQLLMVYILVVNTVEMVEETGTSGFRDELEGPVTGHSVVKSWIVWVVIEPRGQFFTVAAQDVIVYTVVVYEVVIGADEDVNTMGIEEPVDREDGDEMKIEDPRLVVLVEVCDWTEVLEVDALSEGKGVSNLVEVAEEVLIFVVLEAESDVELSVMEEIVPVVEIPLLMLVVLLMTGDEV